MRSVTKSDAEKATIIANPNSPSPVIGESFPISKERIYLSICDSTVLASPVRASVERFLDQVTYWRESRAVRDSVVDATRSKFARLIAAQVDEIAIIKNVSEGINAIATAFDWKPKDNVVLCAELEHPNNVIPWLHLQRLGVEVRIVPPVEGAISPERMIAAIDDRTRVVTCSSVTFAPGLRTDLAPIGRACRSRDVFFLVDAVQSVGILRLDVQADCIDGLVVSTAKGLLGLYGMGFLYCRLGWVPRLIPAYLSRPAVDLAPEKYSEMESHLLGIRNDARRFEVGSVDYASCYAAEAALDLLCSVGMEAVEEHAIRLADRLRRGLAALGLQVTGVRERDRRSHIVTVGELGRGGHEVTADPWLSAISQALHGAHVAHTIRRGMLRFAFHVFNTEQEVDTVVDLVASVPKPA